MNRPMRDRRERRIERIKQRLIMPRVLITMILSGAALSAFLTSFLLLNFGVLRMWVRYPIAILVAYVTFLALLALWLYLQRRDADIDVDLDVVDAISSDWGDAHSHAVEFRPVGDYGGGGSGGDWTGSVSSPQSVVSNADTSDASGLFGLDVGDGEGCLIVLGILAIIGGLVASLYIIWIAPALLAEILIDGALAAGLYQRVKRVQGRHWLRAAVRRTVLPAVLALIFFTTAGYLLQRAIPNAHTMGEVWHHLTS